MLKSVKGLQNMVGNLHPPFENEFSRTAQAHLVKSAVPLHKTNLKVIAALDLDLDG